MARSKVGEQGGFLNDADVQDTMVILTFMGAFSGAIAYAKTVTDGPAMILKWLMEMARIPSAKRVIEDVTDQYFQNQKDIFEAWLKKQKQKYEAGRRAGDQLEDWVTGEEPLPGEEHIPDAVKEQIQNLQFLIKKIKREMEEIKQNIQHLRRRMRKWGKLDPRYILALSKVKIWEKMLDEKTRLYKQFQKDLKKLM